MFREDRSFGMREIKGLIILHFVTFFIIAYFFFTFLFTTAFYSPSFHRSVLLSSFSHHMTFSTCSLLSVNIRPLLFHHPLCSLHVVIFFSFFTFFLPSITSLAIAFSPPLSFFRPPTPLFSTSFVFHLLFHYFHPYPYLLSPHFLIPASNPISPPFHINEDKGGIADMPPLPPLPTFP